MQGAIEFAFGFIAIGMGVMGLFAIFKSIISERDETLTQAFRDGLTVGMHKNYTEKEQNVIEVKPISQKLAKRK